MIAITRRFALAGGLAALGACSQQSAAPVSAADLIVYAAVSLKEPLEEIAGLYARQGGGPVRYNLAGSSVLARQIEQGAQADVFISADLEWIDYLQTRSLIASGTRKDLVTNKLVLIAPAASTTTLAIGPGMALAAALGQGRLALADPASVPAGRYARAALTGLGVWPEVEGKVAGAENVRAALALVARGEAPFGIVYATDARADPSVRIVGEFPTTSHPRIVYPAAAVASSDSPQASAGFVAFLAGPEATAAFERFGFTDAG